MKQNTQHIQLPNGLNKLNLKPKDLLVYAVIKMHINKETNEAFPSLETIATISEVRRNSVIDTIKLLIQYKYLSVRKEGRKNIYKFSEYKTFEVFSYDFLEAKEITTTEKAYLLAIQQFLYKDKSGQTHNALMTLGTMEIAELINMNYRTLIKIENTLMMKGYLHQLPIKINDEFKIKKIGRLYELDKFQQQVVFALQKINEKFEKQNKTNQFILNKIINLEKENIELRYKINKLENNKAEFKF